MTKKEVDDNFDDLVKSNGGETSFAEVLKRYYGLTISDFKENVFRARLLQKRVAEKFSNDESVNQDSKKKAEEVLAKVKAGEDFASLAKQYSQHASRANGGDLGFVTKGKNVPELEQAIFSLKAGQTSELIKTVYGYEIVKVIEIKGDSVKASKILIKTVDFNTWLLEAIKTAKLKKLV